MRTLDVPLIHRRRGEIVSIDGARRRRNETVDEAWERFAAAQQRSKETLSIIDGIAAAKAYADFLDLYVGRRA